jgi:hypothetical protein
MKVFSDNLRRLGTPAQPGERLECLVVDRPNEKLVGNKMMLKKTFLDLVGTDKEEKIDKIYYISKVLQNHIDQLIAVGYMDTINKLNWISFRRSNRCKPIHLDKMIAIITSMLSSGYNEPTQSILQAVTDGIEWLEQQEQDVQIVMDDSN